MLLFSVRISS